MSIVAQLVKKKMNSIQLGHVGEGMALPWRCRFAITTMTRLRRPVSPPATCAAAMYWWRITRLNMDIANDYAEKHRGRGGCLTAKARSRPTPRLRPAI